MLLWKVVVCGVAGCWFKYCCRRLQEVDGGWCMCCCGRLLCAGLQDEGLSIVVGGCRRLVKVGGSFVVEGCCVRGCRRWV